MNSLRFVMIGLATVSFLATVGCSSSSNTGYWSINPGQARGYAMGGAFDLPPDEIKGEVDSQRNNSTVIISGDMVISTGGANRLPANCRGPACTFTNTATGAVIPISLLNPLTPSLEFQGIMTKNGVRIGEGRDFLKGFPSTGTNFTRLAVGGQLVYTFFAVDRFLFKSNTGVMPTSVAWSFGNDQRPPSTVPPSATWSGIMLGLDYSDGSIAPTNIQALVGDANITVTGGEAPVASIRFSNIVNMNTGATRTINGWSDLAISAGRFGDGSTGNKIQGIFYGPNYEEVGGHFERDSVVGSFGAKRPDDQ